MAKEYIRYGHLGEKKFSIPLISQTKSLAPKNMFISLRLQRVRNHLNFLKFEFRERERERQRGSGERQNIGTQYVTHLSHPFPQSSLCIEGVKRSCTIATVSLPHIYSSSSRWPFVIALLITINVFQQTYSFCACSVIWCSDINFWGKKS